MNQTSIEIGSGIGDIFTGQQFIFIFIILLWFLVLSFRFHENG